MHPVLDYIQKNLDYDPVTGVITRKRTGKPTGRATKHDGVLVRLQQGGHYAHRIAWFFLHGRFGSQYMQHRNGNKNDNRADNLYDPR